MNTEKSPEIRKVVVKKNVSGMGHDTENSALFGVRIPFTEFTTDRSMQRTCSIPSPFTVDEAECGEIATIPGVAKVANYGEDARYELWVRKALAYSWAELEPLIVGLLEKRHDRFAPIRKPEVE